MFDSPGPSGCCDNKQCSKKCQIKQKIFSPDESELLKKFLNNEKIVILKIVDRLESITITYKEKQV